MIKKLLLLIRLFFSKQNQNTSKAIATNLFGNNAKWLCSVCFFVFVNLASGQIAQRGTATFNTTGSTTLTITKPTGLAVGDIMIAQIMQSGNNTLTSSVGGNATSTGWTLIAGTEISTSISSYSRATLLYKIATNTDVAAANFSYTLGSSSDDGQGAIIAFSGVDNSNPFDVTPGTVYTNVNDDSTLNANAITTTTAGSAVIMFGAVHNNYNFSNWTTATSPGTLTELYDEDFNADIDTGIGAAWAIKTTAGSTGAGSASISNDDKNGSILIALRKAPPTITSFGASSGCVGGNITINGTNLSGATAANVKIGGTPVTSITTNNGTTIVAVIGSGTTGTVEVTSSAGTVTSAATFTVNPQPTAANAGPDQATGGGSFTLAANTPTVGTGVWSIASGPSTLLSQFSSTSSPTATFTPAVAGTYVLNWAISNSCSTFNDQVVVANNCVTNMISNSDFSGGATGWTFATTYGDRVETNSENTYFSNGSSSLTAELDSEASLRQVMTVIPGVSYTVSFRYSRRDNAITPATTGVTVKVTGGATDFTSTGFTTTSTISQIGTYTFTPTSSSIGLEFYNTLHGGVTLGTIIDDIVLIPTSQVNPSATTSPKGVFNTLISCGGVAVQLDVENVPASGITYAWTGPAGAVFSSTTIKNPTVTLTGSGVQQVSVTTTTAAGCSGSSITYINVTAAPTITAPTASSVCSGSTYSSGAITSTGTTFSWSRAAVANINGGAAGAGGTGIANATGFTEVLTNSTANPINVTYVLTPGPPSSGCSGVPYNLVVTVNPTVGITITAPTASSVCSGSTYSSGAITSTGTTFDWSRAAVANINGGAAGAGGTGIAKATGFSEVLTNSTSSAINVTYVLTPKSASGCSGTPYNLVITVNPTVGITITAPVSGSVCSGSTYSSGAITSTGTTFDWSRAAVANINAGAAGAGGTGIAKATGFSETLTNSTSSAINVTYVLTPKSASGCSGTPYNLVVTVNPTVGITITAPAASSVCSGSTYSSGAITSTGTTFDWSRVAVPNINGGAAGAGGTGIAKATGFSEVLTNSTSSAINVTYVLTPKSASGCSGTPYNLVITVNPTVGITITAPTASSVCSGGTYTSGAITSTGTTFDWSRAGVANINGGAAGAGGTGIANATGFSEVLTNSTSSAINVTYVLTPKSASGCSGTTYNLVITVNPTVGITITAPVSGSVCSGSTYSSGAITSTGTTFDWSRAAVANINAGAAGAGGTGIAKATGFSETLTNSTSSAINVTYVLTPKSASGCSGTPYNLVITVNPTVGITITAPVSGSVCSGSTYSSGAITSTGTTFDWSRAGVANINAGAVGAGGTGIAKATGFSEVLTNSTSSAINVTYVLTPKSASGCSGTPYNLVVTVNPTVGITITAPTASSVCSGSTYSSGAITSTGTTFDWSRVAVPNINGGAAGAGGTGIAKATGFSEVLTNSTSSAINVTYVLTPKSASGCSGTPYNLVITVNPRPAVPTGSAFQVFCSASSPTVANLTATGTGIKWYDASSGGNELTAATALISGNHYYASQSTGCESTTRLDVTAMLNAAPVITPNKVDETCPSSNNGSISPTFSGGLANVRYIRLTQKFDDPDAWLQVAEVNAFEIFTGENVALSSNGASAVASSVYLNDIPGNGPAQAIDGNSGSIYHSNIPNINEYLEISLASPKNIDYLRIYNRNDYFGFRGQNMLLELLDNSHNVVYAKMVDLRGGGTNIIDVNVLDVTWSDTATTLNRTGLDSGSYTLNYADAAGCSASTPITITSINPTPSSPTIGTTTHINCTVNTGSVVLEGLPSGDWTINQTGDAAGSYDNTVPNTTSTTISGLAAGSYTFTVTNANGCPSAESATVTILDNFNTWNGSSWSRGVPPNASMNVVIAAVTPNSPFTADLVGCALTINSGVVATVPSGITLTITNEVTVNGSLTFENNSSLVQINNLNTNSGPITYKRTSQLMKLYDFTYWSSPVENQVLYDLSPNTRWDKYLSYTGDVWKEELSSSTMQPGIGYIIRVPEPNKVYLNGKDFWTGQYAQQLEFTGRPNNGNITSSQYMEKDKYYLIGNPYPSAMHADDFLFVNVNNRGILGGTIYFWTHNTAIKKVGSNYAYVSDDYAAYNLTGGVGTSASSDPGHNDNPSLDTGIKPTGYIAAGQSFFVSAEDGSGHVQFTNSMRYGGTNNSQFFKPGKTSKSGILEKHRLWLNMTNSGGAFKQTLIGYVEGATNSYDKSFDGLTFDGNSYADFYSVNEASNMTIQGRALPFSDADVVPLGYRSTIAGDFTIAIDQADGNLATQRIYLEDKQTGTINELTAKNYTFKTKAGTFNNRFVLRYTNKTLGTGDFETVDDAVWVLAQNKTVTVNSTTENIDKVFIYDISGKQLYKKVDVGNLQLIIQNLPFAQQVLLVKIVLDNGYETTKKVIFK
ncbi:PKD-like domain-containing protein [Flavobacterium hydrophilum]|uniref:PKD-like domain-containing protein n=1 Tax=Flavobacterium hydrophilum TaxID=2211445 RepID=A0A2V4C0P5_9FLAO|nr:PKD-like domain-containing protein [Flavobacterium hydrophilum]PXY44567.1 hypothetical protein DMB68_13960 [Flavobacterium hydrophilum]